MTREYAKLGSTIWNGETGKALRKKGSEALLVAVYLISSPHSNMLGLYYQVIPYMGYETGLGEEGARKGLQACIDVGFCSYDMDSEMVWVHEMAAWQIAEELKPSDLRCKGIQRQYDALPHCPFLGPFFDRYAAAFHMVRKREHADPNQLSLLSSLQAPSQAPSKPGTGARAGARAGAEEDPNPSGSRRLAPTDQADLESKPTIPCPYDSIVDAYHRQLPSLPKIRLRDGPTWTSRQKAMRSFWGWVLSSRKGDGSRRAKTAEEGLAWISAYFGRASENDFVMGRTTPGKGHERWRADFDYLLSANGLKQVIEKTAEAAA